MSETPTCPVCGGHLSGFTWTDTHGIAVHGCGLPFRLIHYEGREGSHARVEKPPECTIRAGWIPVAKAYWEATHRPVFAGLHCMGMQNGMTYSGHTQADISNFSDWVNDHTELHPAQEPGHA